MSISKNIRYLRRKCGWSQDFLAEQLGYKSYTTIQKWESGVSEPPLKKVHAIAALFNVDIDELTKADLEKEQSAPHHSTTLSSKEERDIARQLEATLSQLSDADGALMFDGEPLDDETRDLLRASLENQFRMARILAKEKYTPKKYRKTSDDDKG